MCWKGFPRSEPEQALTIIFSTIIFFINLEGRGTLNFKVSFRLEGRYTFLSSYIAFMSSLYHKTCRMVLLESLSFMIQNFGLKPWIKRALSKISDSYKSGSGRNTDFEEKKNWDKFFHLTNLSGPRKEIICQYLNCPVVKSSIIFCLFIFYLILVKEYYQKLWVQEFFSMELYTLFFIRTIL